MPPAHVPAVSLMSATESDVGFVSGLANDPAVEPFLAVGAGDPARLRALLADTEQPDPTGLFLIRSPESETVGALALRIVNHRSRICELSHLMIRPDTRRAGIASAAVTLACRKALVEHALHRIQLEVYGDNLAAQALFTHAGFVREGVRRRAYWRRERWLDGVQFGMLQGEFDATAA